MILQYLVGGREPRLLLLMASTIRRAARCRSLAQMCQQRQRIFAQHRGSRLDELRTRAVAPEHADRPDSVGKSSFDVVPSIAYHYSFGRMNFFLREDMSDKLVLSGPRAVKLAAVNVPKIPMQPEVGDDLAGKTCGL